MRSLIGIMLAIVLVSGACAGSTSDTVDVGTGSNDSDGDPTTLEEIEYESPLADFLGQDIGAFDRDEAAIIEQQREAERATAACMAEEGFEYIPRDPSETSSFGRAPDDEFEPFSDAWIAKYGFGITTQRFPQSMVGDLIGTSDENFFGPGPESEDPNQEYLEGLTDGELDAYSEALDGPPLDFGPEGPDEDFVFEPSGCRFEGFRNGPGEANVRDFYDAFGDEMQTMRERIEADSRVVAFNADISSCVADRGMEWTSIGDIYQRFEPRLNELQPDIFMAGDPFEAAGLDPEEMSDREVRDFYVENTRLDTGQLAILGELQADEIALAQAVIECGGGPVAEQVLMNEVRTEYEQAFLDENGDALAQYAGD